MGDIRVENYKKSIKRILDRRGGEIAKLDEALGKVDEELKTLRALDAPTDEDTKKIAELEKKQAELRKKITNCVMSKKLELMLIPVPIEAPPKELVDLPKWLFTIS